MVIVVVAGIIYNFSESANEAGVDVWNIFKNVLMFILGMLFLPLLIIFGRTKAREDSQTNKIDNQ